MLRKELRCAPGNIEGILSKWVTKRTVFKEKPDSEEKAIPTVMRGQSHSKNGVASLADDAGHPRRGERSRSTDGRDKLTLTAG
jgi:hypothetical protein